MVTRLTVAAVGSFVAGTLGVAGLMLFAPALAFGPLEYFALALVGLLVLSRVSGGSLWKGLLVLAVGLALGTVGMEPISGVRYTFGKLSLAQGIELVPVAMGLFGMAEVLLVAEQMGGLLQALGIRPGICYPRGLNGVVRCLQSSEGRLWVFRSASSLALLWSSPHSLRTTLERRVAKRSDVFGRGAIEGVAGPEAANNAAATTGAMVPLMALGVPFAPAVAMLLSALMIHGVQPGPLLMQEHPEVFWGLVASMYLGNAALLILNLPLVGMWVSLLRIPQPILLALVLVFMLVGTFSVNNSVLDLFVLIGMGVV
ncbi:MAG: tripartite tricarboxylate transporter permease [candidate division KSB1 bacterium]|nr:tripartite tricarboxylate transporter permease [candidate division KSB1 bacterium]